MQEIIKYKPMKLRFTNLSLIILLSTLVSASFAAEEIKEMPSGLKYQDLVTGTGDTAEIGKIATIHLVGWLDDNGQKGDKFFDSPRDYGRPITFKIGTDRVMKAWNIGVDGMKVGGKRRLRVPAALGYGAKGVDDIVPPNSDLILEIALVEVK